MIIDSIIYYLFCASGVLIYGIGVKKMIISSKQWSSHWLIFLQSLIICIVTIVGTWFSCTLILNSLNLIELFPLISMIIFLLVSEIITSIFSKGKELSILDSIIIFPAIIIAVSESYSLLNSICIGICCCSSYYLLIPIIYAIRERINISHPLKEFKTGTLLFISIAVIICALFATNISWLNLWSF